MGQLVP